MKKFKYILTAGFTYFSSSFSMDIDTILKFENETLNVKNWQNPTEEQLTVVKEMLLDFHVSHYQDDVIPGVNKEKYTGFCKSFLSKIDDRIKNEGYQFFTVTKDNFLLAGGTYVIEDEGRVLRPSPVGFSLDLIQTQQVDLFHLINESFFEKFQNISRIVVFDRPNSLLKKNLIQAAGFIEGSYTHPAYDPKVYCAYECTREQKFKE